MRSELLGVAGLAVVAIGVLSAIPQASASPARCLLDGDSFAIGTAGDGLAASPYFAYAHRGTSYWNGTPPSSHAHDSLPGLYREGACMRNRTGSTRLCAWGL